MVRNVVVAGVLSAGLLSYGLPASSSMTSQPSVASAARAGGWLRLAHLSPNTPAVDVYLYSVTNPRADVVLHHVSYGTVSPYLPAPAGTYTVAMRAAGAAAGSPPVLSTAVRVQAGAAYTVAGMGPRNGLRLVVLSEKLAAPAGDSMVRVIQASMREHLVTVRARAHLFGRDLVFATTTAFQTVRPGEYLVRAAGATESAVHRIALAGGSIHTLVILDAPGRLRIVNLTDAVGSRQIPTIAPPTGFGGTAPAPGAPLLPWVAVFGAGLLLVAAGFAALRRNGRRNERRLAGAR